MKKILILAVMVLMGLSAAAVYAGDLEMIFLYAGDKAGTGVDMPVFKLEVGKDMMITAKGVDKDGNDVPIWPTWKCDKELSVQVVEGKSKTIKVKALKAGEPLFITAIYIDDNGKTFKGEAMGTVK